jgi:hypothetical protein
MKKLVSLLVLGLIVVSAGASFAAPKSRAKEKKDVTAFKDFVVYVQNGSRDNHYIPSGWMGDTADLKCDIKCTEKPKIGNTCIKITYSAEKTQGQGWAGIFWQNPANNWGDKAGGFDLTGAKKLTFWAKGAKGGETIAEFKVGGITGEYPDSDSAAIESVVLTKDWKEYTIDLKGKDLSHIIGGFCFALSAKDNEKGCVFYLDNISFK